MALRLIKQRDTVAPIFIYEAEMCMWGTTDRNHETIKQFQVERIKLILLLHGLSIHMNLVFFVSSQRIELIFKTFPFFF
jgi:hypothetical protein